MPNEIKLTELQEGAIRQALNTNIGILAMYKTDRPDLVRESLKEIVEKAQKGEYQENNGSGTIQSPETLIERAKYSLSAIFNPTTNNFSLLKEFGLYYQERALTRSEKNDVTAATHFTVEIATEIKSFAKQRLQKLIDSKRFPELTSSYEQTVPTSPKRFGY